MSKKITIKQKLSKAEFKKRYVELLTALTAEVLPFPDDPKAQKERVERSKHDHFYFFRTYLPHYFYAEEAPFHHDLIEDVDVRPDPNDPADVMVPVAIATPREFAKTTIMSFGYSIHQICHNLRRFIILGSDTEDLAGDLTGYLLLELSMNQRIRQDFGELAKLDWSVYDFVTKNDVRVLARGRDQRIRGLKHKQWRPDLVILDDLENDKNVKNPRIIRGILKWIKETVYPGVDSSGNLFIIGTILAKRAALNIIIRGEEEPYNHWIRKIYMAIQEDGTSLWPAVHPIEKLIKQKELMGSVAFNKEKQNNPTDEESAFREEWIRYYHKDEIKGKTLFKAAGLDPSATQAGDDKALLAVGLDREEMIYYVLDAWVRKASPAAMMDACYRQHDEVGWIRMGAEDNALKDFLKAVIDEAAKSYGYYLPVVAINHSTNKEARIVAGLSHLVEHGKLRFLKGHSDQDKVVEQLLYLDQPSHPDDGADALETATGLLKSFSGKAEYETITKRRFAKKGAW